MEKNKRLTNKQFRRFQKELDWIIKEYRETSVKKERNWKDYERGYRERIRYVAKELDNITAEAAELITVTRTGCGRPPKLSVQQRTTALLIKVIVMQSNRKMSNLLSLFGALTGIDISYKTIERLYSNDMTSAILHNVFVLTIRKKNLRCVDTSGDGTGYSLTITKHYRLQGSKQGSRNFVYSFKLMDLRTGLYICYGSGVRSEKEAYNNAVKMLAKIKERCGIHIRSERLDRYYSYQSTLIVN